MPRRMHAHSDHMPWRIHAHPNHDQVHARTLRQCPGACMFAYIIGVVGAQGPGGKATHKASSGAGSRGGTCSTRTVGKEKASAKLQLLHDTGRRPAEAWAAGVAPVIEASIAYTMLRVGQFCKTCCVYQKKDMKG
eukprot:1161401-Pelagomonas_calceolata.AAC.10